MCVRKCVYVCVLSVVCVCVCVCVCVLVVCLDLLIFSQVLDSALPGMLRTHEEVWVVTGTGHHVAKRSHQREVRTEPSPPCPMVSPPGI